MTIEDIVLYDEPPYDSEFIRVIALACFIVLAPVFLLIFLFDSSLGFWPIILWLVVPVIVWSIPYLLAVPTEVVLTKDMLRVRHGKLWVIKIPVEQIITCEVMDYPPWWANFQYFYPYAQWVHITKTSGRLGWWYVPTTSATKLVLSILDCKNKEL